VFDQAENRLHLQKGILFELLGSGRASMPARAKVARAKVARAKVARARPARSKATRTASRPTTRTRRAR